jgi:hypothetical protein
MLQGMTHHSQVVEVAVCICVLRSLLFVACVSVAANMHCSGLIIAGAQQQHVYAGSWLLLRLKISVVFQ